MQHKRHAGGTVHAVRSTRQHPLRLSEQAGYMVSGSGSRQVTMDVEAQERSIREQSWLSSALSRGLSGTRLA